MPILPVSASLTHLPPPPPPRYSPLMDLIDDDGPAPGSNAHEFTVSELSGAVKRTLEGEFGPIF